MKNDTLRILEKLAYRYQQEKLTADPECQLLEQRRHTLEGAFLTAHQNDHALILEVNDLLDAQTSLAEYGATFNFPWASRSAWNWADWTSCGKFDMIYGNIFPAGPV